MRQWIQSNIGPMGIRIVARDFEVPVIVAKSLIKPENLELVAAGIRDLRLKNIIIEGDTLVINADKIY